MLHCGSTLNTLTVTCFSEDKMGDRRYLLSTAPSANVRSVEENIGTSNTPQLVLESPAGTRFSTSVPENNSLSQAAFPSPRQSASAALYDSDARASRCIEWNFFKDEGEWKGKSDRANNFRIAKCIKCSKEVRSKRQTMHNHIMKCACISTATRRIYTSNPDSYSTKRDSSNATPFERDCRITNHFSPALKSKKRALLEDQAVRFAVSTNTSFNVLAHPEFNRLLKILNPTATLPGRKALSTTVLNRISLQERREISSVYSSGAYVSLSIDGWKTPTDLKWLGFCNLVRSKKNGEVFIDVTRFEDVTATGETPSVIEEEISYEISTISSIVRGARLTSVISDSHPSNVKAKKELAEKHPDVCFLTCYAHQLNLLAGNVLSHTSTKETVKSAKTIVTFFNTFPKHRAMLQDIMMQQTGKKLEFVVEGDTRWYSHYGMVVSIFRAKESLEVYKQTILPTDPVLQRDTARISIDAIGSISFWSKLGLLSELLRPINIEIGLLETKGACLSDVTQSFGRLWALITSMLNYDAARFAMLHDFLPDMLQRWTWRLNIYYDVDMLVLAHWFDPRVRSAGLLADKITNRAVHDALLSFAKRYCPDIMKVGSLAESSTRTLLRQNFISWINCEEDHAGASATHCPFELWLHNLDFDHYSPLRCVIEVLLSMPATAADLERVWSGTLLTFSARRRRLARGKVLKVIQLKASIEMQRDRERTSAALERAAKNQREDDLRRMISSGGSDASAPPSDDFSIQRSTGTAPLLQSQTPTESTVHGPEVEWDIDNDDDVDAMGQALESIEEFLAAENIEGLVDQFLDEVTTDTVPVFPLTDSQMDALLSDNASSPRTAPGQPALKKRRLPNYRKVTRSLESIFDLSVYKARAEELYSVKLNPISN